MAKDTVQCEAIQFKVLIKPTEIGLLVLKRLQRPHIDRSAELRRFVELGYASEQAGFILDGTVLRHAGRIWDIQPGVAGQLPDSPCQPLASQVQESPAQHPAQPAVPTAIGHDDNSSVSSDAEATCDTADDGTDTKSPLRSRLRNLSG